MRILYLNTTYRCGGAEKVTSQLFQGMKKRGHEVYEIVSYDLNRSVLPEGVHVLYSSRLLRLFNRLITGNHGNRSLHIWYSRRYIRSFIKKHRIDVVHLNNPHDNFLGIRDIEELAAMRPLIWTLHDFWAMTGHCASPHGCRSLWKEGCSSCGCLKNYPALRRDVSGRLFREKQKSFRKQKILFTVPSEWMKRQFDDSHLKGLDCVRIYNSLDTARWKLLDKEEVRRKYQLAPGKKIVGFIASDPQKKLKGMEHLLEALVLLPEPENYLLLVAGKKSAALENLDAKFEIRYLGYLQEQEKLNEFYALLDLLVNPSVYETFGLTSIEAMACGTPVAAFPVCTMPEIIPESCGYIAGAVTGKALAETIRLALSDPETLAAKGRESRRRVEDCFSEERMLAEFEKLYKKGIKLG